jgi:hypothetical protein
MQETRRADFVLHVVCICQPACVCMQCIGWFHLQGYGMLLPVASLNSCYHACTLQGSSAD